MTRCKKCKKKPFISSLFCGCKNHGYFTVIGLVFIVTLVVAGLLYPGFLKTKAAPIVFSQTDWSGGAVPGSSTTNLTGWDKYDSANGITYDTSDPNPANHTLKLTNNHKEWSGSQVQVSSETYSYYTAPQVAKISVAGEEAVVAVWVSTNGANNNVYVQKIYKDGSVGGGAWGSALNISGASHPPAYGSGNLGYKDSPKIASVGDAVMVTWADVNGIVRVQKVAADGTFGSALGGSWSNDGIEVSGDFNYKHGVYPRIVPISGGRAVVVWNYDSTYIYAQRINSDGTTDGDSWGSNGLRITSDSVYNDYGFEAANGINSVIISWLTNGRLISQKVNEDGSVSWGTGVAVSNSAQGTSAGTNYDNYNTNVQIYSVGNSYIHIFNCGSVWGVCVQRVKDDGSVGGESWQADGTNLTPGYTMTNSFIGSPSSDGYLFIRFTNMNGQRMQKIAEDGTLAWTNPIEAKLSTMSADSSGGVLFFDGVNNNGRIKAARINGAGEQLWINEYSEDLLSTVPSTSVFIDGSMVAVWDEKISDGPAHYQMFAQRYGENGENPSSGELVSSIFDTGTQSDWGSLGWTASFPSAPGDTASITFETRTAVELPGNISLGKTAYASTSLNMGTIYGPEYAVDGLLGDGNGGPPLSWITDFGDPNGSTDQWIAVDIGSSVSVKKAIINSFTDGSTYYTPTDYVLQYSNDSTDGSDGNWTDVPGTNSSIDPNVDQNPSPLIIELSFTPVDARFIRLFMPTLPSVPGPGGSINAVIIREFELYSSDWSCAWGHCPSTTLTYTDGSSGVIDLSSLDPGRYFQYKMIMTSGSTPSFSGVTISSTPTSTPPPPPPPSAPPSSAYTLPPSSFIDIPIDASLASGQTTDGFVSIESNPSIDTQYNGKILHLESSSPTGNLGLTIDGTPLRLFDVSIPGVASPTFSDPLRVTFTVQLPAATDPDDLILYHDTLHNGFASGATTFQKGDPNVTITLDPVTNIATFSFLTSSLSNFILALKEEPTPINAEICANTLAQIQLSAIPPFNPTWGVGYAGGRVSWALQHRKRIYELYVAYLKRQPCATEVNWVLQHDNDINNIRYNMLTSDEYKELVESKR